MPTCAAPHYLLFAESTRLAPTADDEGHGWRFLWERVDDGQTFSAADHEAFCGRERAELLAVVRGLEALEGASRVTLVTGSRYVSRGLRRGLQEWRFNAWRWERFGQLTSVRDADLWRRVDVALQFHQLECRLWQFADAGGELVDREPLVARRRLPRELGRRATLTNRMWRAATSTAVLGQPLAKANLAAG